MNTQQKEILLEEYMNNNLEKLKKIMAEYTEEYLRRKEAGDDSLFYDSDDEFVENNDEWFFTRWERTSSLIEREHMIQEDKNINTASEIQREVKIIPSATKIPEVNYIPPEVTPTKIQEEITKDCFSIDNHIKIAKDLSLKASYLAGSYAINSALTSIGLPPITGLKYIFIGGVKVASFVGTKTLDAYIYNTTLSTGMTAMGGFAYKYYFKKEVKKTIKEDPYIVPNVTAISSPPTVQVVNQPSVESHSIGEFMEIVVSITWKVLKKIHDFLT